MSGTPPIGPDGGMARVLVVLDLPLLVKLIMLTLKHGIWIVRTATTLEQVAASAIARDPDVLILHGARRLPHAASGQNQNCGGCPPLVMGLVGRGDLWSTLAAFDAGADDILTIPFEPEELLARVTALMRRRSTPAAIVLTPVITVGELDIDLIKTRRAGGWLGAAVHAATYLCNLRTTLTSRLPEK